MLSRSTVFAILSSQIRVYTVCHSQQSGQGQQYLLFSVWSSSTLFAILNSQIRFYTVCHSQQYDQCLHYFPFFLRSIFKVYCLPNSAVWSGSTLFAIRSSLIKVKVHCHPQKQSDQGLHYLPVSAVWSTILAILSLIRVYTICHSHQSHQFLYY